MYSLSERIACETKSEISNANINRHDKRSNNNDQNSNKSNKSHNSNNSNDSNNSNPVAIGSSVEPSSAEPVFVLGLRSWLSFWDSRLVFVALL